MAEITLNSNYFISLYKARNNILEILEDSNYDVGDYKEFSMHELNTIIQNNQLDMVVSRENNGDEPYTGKK